MLNLKMSVFILHPHMVYIFGLDPNIQLFGYHLVVFVFKFFNLDMYIGKCRQ